MEIDKLERDICKIIWKIDECKINISIMGINRFPWFFKMKLSA